jgi:hypothetical protein
MKIDPIYSIVGALSLALLANIGPVTRYVELLMSGVETTGAVTDPTCINHSSFRYSFRVGDRAFAGAAAYGAAKSCGLLTAGEPVIVFYLPSDPSINISGVPKKGPPNELKMFGLAVLGLTGAAGWALLRRRRKHAA